MRGSGKIVTAEREIIRSYGSDIAETNAIRFFHIGKTGGTTFTGILFAMAQGLKANHTFIPEMIGQFRLPFDSSSIPKNSLVYAGHCQYNFSKFLPATISRVSLVRNPIDRVVSEYFWVHRTRKNEQYLVEHKDYFIQYLKNCTNSNECCRHLIESHSIFWDSATIAISEIEKSFCFGTTENINAMASYMLSKYNAPSVVVENAKVNSDPRQSYFKNTFAEYILDFNRYDNELYEYVKKQESRHRFEPDKNGPLNTDVIFVQNVSGKNFNFRKTTLDEFEEGIL